MAGKSNQGRLDASTMFPMMEMYEDSGLTQKQFCSQMGLMPHTFNYWRNKYRKTKKSDFTKEAKAEFVELKVALPPQSPSPHRLIRISYPDGTLIELPVL